MISGSYTRHTTLISGICMNHPLQHDTKRRPIFEKCQKWNTLRLCSLWFTGTLKHSGKFCELSTHRPDQQDFQGWHWFVCESIRWKKVFWLNLGESQYQAFFRRKEQSLQSCCFFIWILEWYSKTFNTFCSSLQRSPSTILFSMQAMLEERETRDQFLVLWLRQWSY